MRGFLPFAASALDVYFGDRFAGLCDPIVIVRIGLILRPEGKDRALDTGVDAAQAGRVIAHSDLANEVCPSW